MKDQRKARQKTRQPVHADHEDKNNDRAYKSGFDRLVKGLFTKCCAYALGVFLRQLQRQSTKVNGISKFACSINSIITGD
ncbi:hypothetical protein D3C86_1707360 [compost metagenome]